MEPEDEANSPTRSTAWWRSSELFPLVYFMFIVLTVSATVFVLDGPLFAPVIATAVPFGLVGILVYLRHCTNREYLNAKAADFRICIRCRYSLSKLGDSGTCPECGTPFTAEGLRAGWKARLKE